MIPDFYGTITNIQAALWPSLHMFLGDKLPPNAVLIKYIPNMQLIDLSNFLLQYLREFGHVLKEIHRAGVLHGDPKPRNMMISGDQGRVLWIDFDSAQTFSGSLSTRQRTWIEEENEMIEYFVEALVCLHRLCATLINSVPGARLRGRRTSPSIFLLLRLVCLESSNIKTPVEPRKTEKQRLCYRLFSVNCVLSKLSYYCLRSG